METEITEAEDHVTGCQVCQQYLQFNNRFQQLLQKKFLNTATPSSVRENLLDTLASIENESPKSMRVMRSRKWIIWAAVFTIFIIGSVPFAIRMFHQNDSTAQQLVSMLIQDHIEIQLGENPVDLQTSDKEQLRQWFAKRVDFAVDIPVIQTAILRGGRLCYLLKKRVAFIVFDKAHTPISAYILNGEGINLSSLDQITSSNGRTTYLGSESGYNAILWKSNGLIYAFVSSMRFDELEQLVATRQEG